MRDLARFVASLICSQGEGVGEPLQLLPWERDFITAGFRESVQVAALSVARGNGKTTLAAGIAAAAVDGPLAQPRGQCVIVAASLNQARLLHGHVEAFLEAREGGPLKRPKWRNVASPNEVSIRRLDTRAEVRAVACDPARLHGLAPSLVLADEPAQWPRHSRDRVFAALETSLGKLPGSRLIALGTRAVAGASHPFNRLIEGGADYIQVHAAAPDADPLDRAEWARANPSLPYFPHLAAAVKREAKAAARDPELLPQFRALRLNAGVPDVAVGELLTATAWERCLGEAEQSEPRAWGIDLASGGAMSAVASYSLATGALDVLAAFPAVPGLAERGRRDGVGDLYGRLAELGELSVHPGRVVQVPALLAEALARWGPPALIAADYHRRAELRDALDEAAIPPCKLELRQGGWGDGAEDVSRFRRACLAGDVVASRSLLLATAIGEARTVANAAGLEKLAKSAQGTRRHRARDDAAVAAVVAVGIGERNRQRVMAKRRSRRWAVVG